MSAETTPGFVFRAFWPVRDETVGYANLIREAAPEIPLLFGQAKARPTGPGRFSIELSAHVPGSGNVTPTVLVYEATAVPIPTRHYHRSPRHARTLSPPDPAPPVRTPVDPRTVGGREPAPDCSLQPAM